MQAPLLYLLGWPASVRPSDSGSAAVMQRDGRAPFAANEIVAALHATQGARYALPVKMQPIISPFRIISVSLSCTRSSSREHLRVKKRPSFDEWMDGRQKNWTSRSSSCELNDNDGSLPKRHIHSQGGHQQRGRGLLPIGGIIACRRIPHLEARD